MPKITRRQFLKSAAMFSTSTILSSALPRHRLADSSNPNKPNIFILLFDAMSARHMSVYGYPRRTTPNLERFAQRSVVYHSHYSGGNFTTPGTASILTGMYPWTQRAINLAGLVKRDLIPNNIFSLIGSSYYRAAYSQNMWVDLFLRQFNAGINSHISPSSFKDFDVATNLFLGQSNIPDSEMMYYAYDVFLQLGGLKPYNWAGSPSLGYLDELRSAVNNTFKHSSAEYPFGLPYNGFYDFEIPTVMEGVWKSINRLSSQPSSVFGYFHLWAPHEPLNPRRKFIGSFPKVNIIRKPFHYLSSYHITPQEYVKLYDRYDAYIADVDEEFGMLLDKLESYGILNNSYFVITADHGQLFERGEQYHKTKLLYDPIIHVPLLISCPGSKQRQDVFTPTSAVDLLPTLLNLAGQPIPGLVEGRLLPGLGGQSDLSRSIFTVEAKDNSAFKSLTETTISMIKDNFKLIYYKGYENYNNIFELYDLSNDLEEMHNLIKKDTKTASRLKAELLNALQTANRPFQG